MHRFRLFVIPFVFALATCTYANGIFLTGGMGSPPASGWGGVQVHFVPGSTGAYTACEITGHGGEFAVKLDRPGIYTAAVLDANGFGPIVRPGIRVTEGGYNRVNVLLNLCIDLVGAGEESDEHTEYGQTFKAEGTSVTGIAFKNAERILISMHEDGPEGRQIGETVRPATYYPHGVLPTEPGKTYYLRFVREDGTPFRMHTVSGNRYANGRAFVNGQGKDELDLALRVQYDPAGQILRSKPGLAEAYQPAKRSYGQTFTAKGNGLALFAAFPAWGDKPPAEVTIRVFEGGPGGPQIGPSVKRDIMAFKPGDLRLTPGGKYYIEITAEAALGELRMWTERKDTLPGGELYLDGKPVVGRDLAMVLVEYEPDTTAPPPPSTPVMHRSPADGRGIIIFDVPPSNDIQRVVIRRNEAALFEAKGEGAVIADLPVFSQGRHSFLDRRLKNGVRYIYSMRTVDGSGNESPPTRVWLEPVRGLPVATELINPDFTEPSDFRIPYGWKAVLLDGVLPTMQLGPSDYGADSPIGIGWTVGELGQNREKADLAFYQRVPCESGRRYEFSAEMRIKNPWNSREMVITAVPGIDPTGGTDPLAKTVIWGTRVERRDRWTRAFASATAVSDHITVFLRGYSRYSREMETIFRSIELREVLSAR